MNATCFRCNRSAFATIKIQATIGETTLEVSKHGKHAALCAACMIELAAWFNSGDRSDDAGLGAALGGRLGNPPGGRLGSLW